MVLAVNYGYKDHWNRDLLLITAFFGATFVGMQVFEWTKLIVDQGVRPWSNPMGAPQFGAIFYGYRVSWHSCLDWVHFYS